MSRLKSIIRVKSSVGVEQLIKIRFTRFRQLLRNYGKILDLISDAAEKQGGQFILDKQYINTLTGSLFDLAEAIVYDLNVITDQRHIDFFDCFELLRERAYKILETGSSPSIQRHAQGEDSPRKVTQDELTRALSGHTILYDQAGQVACRGVASGPVFNLSKELDIDRFPDGGILVAREVMPEAEQIRLMANASAVLTDFGMPATDMASLAREFHIPTIVGLKDATDRLATGSALTVDADENVIYEGRIEKLLDYYQGERLDEGEDPEYRSLREIRREVFPLTLADPEMPPAEIQNCHTLHDVVHLAHELAGDCLIDLESSRNYLKKFTQPPQWEIPITARVIDIGYGHMGDNGPEGGQSPDNISSRPLQELIDGLCTPIISDLRFSIDDLNRQSSIGNLQFSRLSGMFLAVATEESANLAIFYGRGIDVVDTYLSDGKESNHIYCRVSASTVGAQRAVPLRATVAGGILSRLNFAVAHSSRAVTSWINALPRPEIEERLRIIGRMMGYIQHSEWPGADDVDKDALVDRFFQQHT